MAFGDGDLALFFGLTGVPVLFGGQSTRGNYDEAGDVGKILGIDVQDSTPSVEIARGSLSPMPQAGQAITVDGRSYAVRKSLPLDDGAIVKLLLKVK